MINTKSQFLFHASPNAGITEFEPRDLSTPGVERGQSPKRVFASDDPAYAAGHGFSWGNSRGVSLGLEDDENGKKRACLKVQWDQADLLKQPVHVYTLPAADFTLLEHVSPKGRNFASETPVTPIAVQSFPDVKSAVEFYGGVVEIAEPS